MHGFGIEHAIARCPERWGTWKGLCLCHAPIVPIVQVRGIIIGPIGTVRPPQPYIPLVLNGFTWSSRRRFS